MTDRPNDPAEAIRQIVAAIEPALIEVRRDIHAHPELCFEEERTADVVARTLASLGIEVHRGLGKTGVVGVVRGKHPGARA